MVLSPVLYVPNLSCNLLSISKLTQDMNCVTKFFPTYCEFQEMESGKTIGCAWAYDGLYIINNKSASGQAQNVSSDLVSVRQSRNHEIMLWHFRLGHPSFPYLKMLFPSLFKDTNLELLHCEVCQLSKQSRVSYSPQSYQSTVPFSLIHSDLWGPSKISNINGAKWFITLIDDHTRISWVYLMKDKTEVRNIFKSFHSMIQTQFKTQIQILRSDNGTKYINSILGAYLSENGIIHQKSCWDTPQQNGVAERKNRHLLEVARSLLFISNVPKFFWGEAILTATYLINRLPSRVLKFQTPVTVLKATYPNIRIINSLPPKVFGCSVFVYIHNQGQSKLDPRAIKCLFLGYSSTRKGYRCYSLVTRKFYTSMNVKFFEQIPYYSKTSLEGESPSQGQAQFWESVIPIPIESESSSTKSFFEFESVPATSLNLLSLTLLHQQLSSEFTHAAIKLMI
ncbi:Retrovirus-related Pol polyprotein from transposon TNT 1-94 [Melia azedarach]|uniref:Retrovirus-related Pol polyprotein from transposon TNT 1-94 n=1 Tax=Melia azedarach TaxID=155640 RepID=A0ACC1WPS0_MELAZ|nr:Retrovirus-related Pol polyprotein from transposon TNT 1-94 [Melia azedarach]